MFNEKLFVDNTKASTENATENFDSTTENLTDTINNTTENACIATENLIAPTKNATENFGSTTENLTNTTNNATENVGNVIINTTHNFKIQLSQNQAQIMKLLLLNSSITSQKIAILIGIRADNVRKNLLTLKKQGLIERIGPDKGGFWKVKQNG